MDTDRSQSGAQPHETTTSQSPLADALDRAMQITLPLEIDQTLVYYDGPLVFTAFDARGRSFLVSEVDERQADGGRETIALAVELSESDMDDVCEGRADLRSAFDGTLCPHVHEITWSAQRADTRMVAAADVPDVWLPEPDVRLP
jgi:hypothetical protein